MRSGLGAWARPSEGPRQVPPIRRQPKALAVARGSPKKQLAHTPHLGTRRNNERNLTISRTPCEKNRSSR